MKTLCFTTFFILTLGLIALQSCRHCPDIQTVSTTKTEIVFRDSIIPGALIRDTVPDTILQALPKLKVITKIDSSGRAQLTYWKDLYGNLLIKCEALQQKAPIIVTSTSNKSKETVKPRYTNEFYVYVLLFIIALILLIFLRKT